ncbi:MAG: hypothetical protein QOF25_4283 [Mycobacterium sp.]|jgi:hypothetical protein|nr:hypothetical protein [Mycobacterium sp.]
MVNIPIFSCGTTDLHAWARSVELNHSGQFPRQPPWASNLFGSGDERLADLGGDVGSEGNWSSRSPAMTSSHT